MKKSLVFLLLLTAGIARGQTVVSLAGKVVDSTSNKPLSNCSVYLNNTSIGTITSEDGVFLLKNIPRGRADLVISAIGYATYVRHLRGDSLPKDLRVRLRQNAEELSSFVVESYLKDGWRQWGKFFLDNFIGTTENASSCTLVNRKALRFHYLKKSRRLTVSATEPLIIHNKALGYDLQYQLEHFSYDEDTHIVFYQGYPLFREKTTHRDELRQVWVERRKKAYLGSLHHFIQSLYRNRLSEQGFLLEHVVRVSNEEKGKVVRANDSELVTALTGGRKALSFEGPLTVKYYYQREPLPGDYWESHLTLLKTVAVEIEENGGYFPSEDLLADGYWAQSEKICNLLALDYVAPGTPGR